MCEFILKIFKKILNKDAVIISVSFIRKFLTKWTLLLVVGLLYLSWSFIRIGFSVEIRK